MVVQEGPPVEWRRSMEEEEDRDIVVLRRPVESFFGTNDLTKRRLCSLWESDRCFQCASKITRRAHHLGHTSNIRCVPRCDDPLLLCEWASPTHFARGLCVFPSCYKWQAPHCCRHEACVIDHDLCEEIQ